MMDVYAFYFNENKFFLLGVSLSHRSALPQAAIGVRFWDIGGFRFVEVWLITLDLFYKSISLRILWFCLKNKILVIRNIL
jgi:hypothetical protein